MGNKSIFIGSDDFCKIIEGGYYYVDKTLLAKKLIDRPAEVTLFTRPRRFGKTLNMMMLKAFFENIPGSSRYFENLKIWECGEIYRKQQGKYPVIFLTFKDAKCNTWQETYEAICRLIQKEFNRHEMLGHFDGLNEYQRKQVDKILNETAGAVVYKDALADLTEYLHQTTGIRPMILIDEYDTPIMQGYEKGFGSEVTGFIRNLFSGGMKNNVHLERAVMTGILRIAQEDIFSGLNNIRVATILDQEFSDCFGFTQEEVEEIAAYYHAEQKLGELREWYDGYWFGKTDIYNPWSVMNYFAAGCVPGTYWVSTSSNDIIQRCLVSPSAAMLQSLSSLLNGDVIQEPVARNIAYGVIEGQGGESVLYTLLLMSGYLCEAQGQPGGEEPAEAGLRNLKIPNREIEEVYRREIFERLVQVSPSLSLYKVRQAMFSGDSQKIQTLFRELLLYNASFYDTASEGFYHALVLGLLSCLGGNSRVYSNRESGDGRYDLALVDYAAKRGILFEFKVIKTDTSSEKRIMEELRRTAESAAIGQIDEKAYDVDLKKWGITKIEKYGAAFAKKFVAVVKKSD